MTVSFGELLRRHRLSAALTQASLAELAGLSEQAISLLERGSRRRPRLDTIQALSAALKLKPADERELFAAVRSQTARPRGPVDGPATVPVPWELPASVADFTAREGELDSVLGALARAEKSSSPVIITGMGGIGKTALAVHAGHLAAAQFPDGQLYVKLRGHDPGTALTSAEALAHLLRSLGVRHEAIPSGVDEMAGLYRSRIAGRRMLILLDDANSVAQVTPLLPGEVGSATIITSRKFLATLPGTVLVRLSTFAKNDSLRLLSTFVGQSRVKSEAAAARELATLTGGLPLALRLIGARLAARPAWLLQYFVDQLQNEHRRLDELGLDHSGVRATFALSLNELTASPREADRQAADAFDLLSLTDGTEISVPVVARLLDQDEPTAERLLERLVDMHLLDSIAPARYRIHDLLRAYANERLSIESRRAERVAAIERGMQYYVAIAWRVHHLTHPWSPRRPPEELDTTGVPDFADPVAGTTWIDAEYDSIIDLFRKASDVPGLARRFGPTLALGLFGYLEIRAHGARMRALHDLALASGNPEDDLVTFGWLEHDRAIPEVEQGNLTAGRARLLGALEYFERANDIAGMARSCSSLSHVDERLDHLDEAIRWGERGRGLARTIRDTAALGTSHLALGVLYNRVGRAADAEAAFAASFELAANARSLARRRKVAAFNFFNIGQYDRGIEHLNVALEIFGTTDDPVGLAEAIQHLSEAQLAMGNYRAAEDAVREGILVTAKYRDSYREAWLLSVLASIQDATGKPSAAQRSRAQAIRIFEAEGATTEAEKLRNLQAT